MLVPAGADAAVETTVAEHIDGRGDFRQQRRVAIPDACHHLPDVNALRVARQRRRDRPALEDGFLFDPRHSVKMVVHPDRVVHRQCIGGLRNSGHCLVFGYWVVDLDQVEPPALWRKGSETNGHDTRISFP